MTALQLVLTLSFGISTYFAYLIGMGKGYQRGYTHGVEDVTLLASVGKLEFILKKNKKDDIND